jgi:trimethylamine--corrinoid protein Co-methyltransferase
MTFSPTPPLQPLVPAYRLQVLSDQQLDDLQAATLEILREVGVHCPSPRALQLYAEHGAQVDFGTQVVKLPSEMVVGAMSFAPRTYTLGARSRAHDIQLDGTAMYCATDGCGVEVIDFQTRQRRPSRKDDVAQSARLADYLSSVGFYWPMVSAQDFPTTAPLHELEVSYANTVKHVQTETVMGEKLARYAVEMARAVAGDEATLRQRPPLSLLACTIAPLAQDRDGMESALVFAEAGLPVGFMSMATTGSTAPATLAGTIVEGDAEIVAAMVLIQLVFPGAPVCHSLMPGVMHPHTGAYLATPWEGELSYAVGVELAHRWGVPSLAGVYGTDAPAPGWQAAEEATTALMLCALCGAETGAGMGLLEGCTLLYPEELVLDTDIYHRTRIALAGLDTSPAALALDVIKAVGPRGHYLRHRHTREHMRRRVFSDLTAQPAQDGTLRDPVEVAQDKVNWILSHHYPMPLEEAQQREISRILRAADHELG